MHSVIWLAVVLGIACPGSRGADPPNQDRRLAVMDLDDAQVRASAREIFGQDLDVGHGIRKLVADRLRRSNYTVVEWKALDDRLTAAGIPPDKRTSPDGARRVARVLGDAVDGVVLGVVRQLSRTTKSGPTTIGPAGETLPLSRTDQQVAAIELRLMDARTGDLVAASEGRGVSTMSESLFRPQRDRKLTGSGVDFASPEFEKSMPGEAIAKAVEEAGTRLANANWIRGQATGAPEAASELLARMLVKEIDNHRSKGFDDDLAIQPSSADLSPGRTVFVHPMAYDFHLELAKALRTAEEPLFKVVDDPRTADLWIRGKVWWGAGLGGFNGELSIVPRGSETVLWSGKTNCGGYDPRKDTYSSALAKKLVRRISTGMGLRAK